MALARKESIGLGNRREKSSQIAEKANLDEMTG